jgi:two-component system cell cycle response regulator
VSGHVLLIGDDGPARNALRDRLHHALFNVTPCDRLGSIDADQYDCVLDTRGRIPPKSQFAHAALPILAICDANRDHGDILGQGAEDVIAAPFHDRELIARIRAMIRRRHASRELKLREGTNRALGFNESPDVFAHQKTCFVVTRTGALPPALAKLDTACLPFRFRATAPQDFQTMLADRKIDAVLFDFDPMDAEQAPNILLDMRAHPNTRYAAILCMYGADRLSKAYEALELGADDVFAQTASGTEILHRITLQWQAKDTNAALRQSNQIGLYAAVTDTLTGLFNRRYAMTHIQHLCKVAQTKNGSVTALMIDIDHFKLVNDTFGHFAGDQVLIAVAETLKSAVRASDLVARMGGEEFVILLPDIKERDAKRLADRQCQMVRKMKLDAITGSVTISIGVSRYDPTSLITYVNPDILKQADAALYTAKRNGRDQVSYFTQF